MSHRAALVVGAGPGARMVEPVLKVIAATGVALEWERFDVPATGVPLTADVLQPAADAIRRIGVGLKTRLGQRAAGRFRSPNVLLRRMLDLFATVRPIRTLPGLATRYPDLNLLLVRENTEDIYSGIEHEVVDGVVQSLKVVTRQACERIIAFAFDVAAKHQRKHVTFVHKANIMKMTDGLFLNVFKEAAAAQSTFETRTIIVDNCCMQLVMNPYQFDVMVMGNLYGDILSELATGLAGGLSTAAGVNIGDGCRVYEAIHGELAGDGAGAVNPLPLLMPATHLLRHLGEGAAADRVVAAVGTVLEQASAVTPDLGGSASGDAMGDAIVAAMG